MNMLLKMMIVVVLLLFPGVPIIIWVVDLTLANPSVAESSGAPIIRLIPYLYLLGNLVGIPLMIYYVVKNR